MGHGWLRSGLVQLEQAFWFVRECGVIMGKHDHKKPIVCVHDLKWCQQCDVVYCARCEREWGSPQSAFDKLIRRDYVVGSPDPMKFRGPTPIGTDIPDNTWVGHVHS